LPTTRGADARMLVADLNLDGKKDIVLQVSTNEWFSHDIYIINSSGSVISKWTSVAFHYSGMTAYPAIGNFDDDFDYELVIAGQQKNHANIYDKNGNNNTGVIAVYNIDGSLVRGWPVFTKGFAISSPVVGDLDSDGVQEIFVALSYFWFSQEDGGAFIFKRNGSISPGWPVMVGRNAWSTPSLADFNKDGKLEIAAQFLKVLKPTMLICF